MIQDGVSSGATWNKQPTLVQRVHRASGREPQVRLRARLSGTGTIEFNVTSMVAKAAASNWSTLTVGSGAIDEGTKDQWKRFNHASPKLAITYNTPPTAPADRIFRWRGVCDRRRRGPLLSGTPILARCQALRPGQRPAVVDHVVLLVAGWRRAQRDGQGLPGGSGNNTSMCRRRYRQGGLTDGTS